MKTLFLVFACLVTLNCTFAKTTLTPGVSDVIKKEPILDTGSVKPGDLDVPPDDVDKIKKEPILDTGSVDPDDLDVPGEGRNKK